MIVGVRIEAGPNNGSHKEEGTNKSEEKKKKKKERHGILYIH